MENIKGVSRINLNNLIGQQVMNLRVDNETRMDLYTGHLPRGIYFLKLEYENGDVVVKKLSKK